MCDLEKIAGEGAHWRLLEVILQSLSIISLKYVSPARFAHGPEGTFQLLISTAT